MIEDQVTDKPSPLSLLYHYHYDYSHKKIGRNSDTPSRKQTHEIPALTAFASCTLFSNHTLPSYEYSYFRAHIMTTPHPSITCAFQTSADYDTSMCQIPFHPGCLTTNPRINYSVSKSHTPLLTRGTPGLALMIVENILPTIFQTSYPLSPYTHP